MTVATRTRAGHHHQSSIQEREIAPSTTATSSDGGHPGDAMHTRRRSSQAAVVMMMAPEPSKGKARAGRTGDGQHHHQQQHTSDSASHTPSSATPSLPAIAPAPPSTSTSTATSTHDSSTSSSHPPSASTRSARSSTRRLSHAAAATAAGDKDTSMDGPTAPSPTIVPHPIPDNILQAQGLAEISTSLIDSLPERAFPKKGVRLHPQDQADPLLLLCGRVLASVNNRALTPKEIALVLARRHGWTCSGSQPFAIVSSCIRSHVRRAGLANPPYNPIFQPYELSSVPPAEDIPCLGIEAESKPVVKRGTFWYLSDSMGYGYPFPHRLVQRTSLASNTTALSTSTSTTSASHTPSSSSSNIPSAQTQHNISNAQHRRSSSRHQPHLAPAPPHTQPIPIMPAPAPSPASTSSTLSASRTKSDIKTDRLTRAQRMAQSSSTTSVPISPNPESNIAGTDLLAKSAPPQLSDMQLDPLGRGKRKRTTSKPAQGQQLQQQPLVPALDVSIGQHPHLQQQPQPGSTAQANFQSAGSVPNLNHKKGPHRRAFSSSASDKIAQRPIPALRKLKLRLSAVSESAVLESDTSLSSIPGADLSMSSLPVQGSADNKKITIASGSNTKKSNGNSKQPKNKRQRTQSMSHRTNTTASFPFDDLHLHYSMQQAALQAGSSSSFNASTSLGDGTLYPFEMHIPSSPQNALDLLTSRSAPEGNIFSPALAGHNANATVGITAGNSYVAGPFSRSHSPSSSLLHYHRQQSGRRSLPPDYGNEDVQDQKAELEYDGWGMESDHALTGGRLSSSSASRNGKNASDADAAGMEDSFHEAMLKNDDIDFAFDFSLGSLGESASRLNIQENGGNDSENLSSELDGPDALREEGEAEESHFSRSASVLDVSNDSSGNQQSSHLGSFLDGLGEENDNSRETVKEKRKKSRSVEKDVDMSGEGNDSTLEAEQEDDQEEEEETIQEAEGEERDQASPSAILDRKAFEKALSTTLCPAAAKFSIDGAKPGRLLTKRTNSSSGLTFARALPRSSEALKDQIQAPTTSLLRPPSVSRTNSRDVLSTAVPLAELPSIPLENNRRDSFLFYHLTSDAAQPLDFSSASHSTLMEGKENHDQQSGSTRDDMSDAASSSSASSSSSLLTRIVKSEEELDEMVDMEEHDEDAQQDSPATHRGVSRCCSTASATSRAEVESNDSFNPEMIYPIGRRAPSADLGNIGGQGEIDELHHQQNSRSQSSSRTTSLSPRDSFSPHMVGPHGSSSELDADWALTPPSEEEHVDEEEKNLDRATMLGIESVGMEDFDDVWPGVRRSLGASAVNGNIEAQVDGVTSGFKIMEVFEPVLSAAPIPQAELPPSFVFPKTLTSGEDGENEVTVMEVDQTPMDEHTAAAMFIADESLHPPKPAPIVTVTAASEDGLQNTPQPSLSPVSAAARDATSAADAQQVTSHAVNMLQQQKSAPSEAGKATTSTSATNQVPIQPASTQSFLFYPDKPFHPEISILLTDTKILFYSTIVNVSNDGRPLLRRVDNDAVDAEALLLSLEGASDLDVDRIETLRKIKELGNTWVSIDFARELLNKYGGPEPLLGIFLADDILLAWNEKLVKLGTMLRQKNGLLTPTSNKANKSEKTAAKVHTVKMEKAPLSSSPKLAAQAIQPKSSKSSSPSKEDKFVTSEASLIPIKSKKELETKTNEVSPAKKEKVSKVTTSARRASSRIKPTGS